MMDLNQTVYFNYLEIGHNIYVHGHIFASKRINLLLWLSVQHLEILVFY
jgi:hypothetical protein